MIDIPQYIHQCAPQVAQSTMQAIIQTESKGNPLAIGLNKGHKLKYQPLSVIQARKWVEYLEMHGYNFDVGLAQVNINNIHKYGYRAADALEPCTNLKLASAVLKKSYFEARAVSKSDNEALVKAISAYNTGNYNRGLYNGYVRRVYANANYTNFSGVPPVLARHKHTNITVADSQTSHKRSDPRRSKSILYVRAKNAAASFY
ncbi:MAG: trwN [Burkholderiales bacterium]|jgi:type IV secretion system protein VirB1|nr:trwN [Burkholderiales bacterium]